MGHAECSDCKRRIKSNQRRRYMSEPQLFQKSIQLGKFFHADEIICEDCRNRILREFNKLLPVRAVGENNVPAREDIPAQHNIADSSQASYEVSSENIITLDEDTRMDVDEDSWIDVHDDLKMQTDEEFLVRPKNNLEFLAELYESETDDNVITNSDDISESWETDEMNL